MTIDLPIPKRTRWQPIRSGLINLFHYADEQFWYEDGRMLLRGNNGTGKSRVLALQLPFLLDAELSPGRMEPDRSPSKRPEWNLLLGGKHRDRLGYTWIEFGRVDDAGQPHYYTLGCGLHAVEHRGGADAWFFTLTGRIGQDLNLVVDSVPLSKPRLTAALAELPDVGNGGSNGGGGQVYARQGDYRRAVDEKLFRLGNRYRSLIDLLIQLRVPQLSRDFDEQRMNAQLSSALPPLPVDVLAQVADAMKDLDQQRERLDELRRSSAGAIAFSQHYRRYLQITVRRRVEALSTQHNKYEKALRTINDTTRQLDEASAKLESCHGELSSAETDRRKIRASLSALKSRPEMRDALRLDEMRQSCERLSATLRRASVEREQAALRRTETKNRLRSEADLLKFAVIRTREAIHSLIVLEAPSTLADTFAEISPTLIGHELVSKPLAEIDKRLNACNNGLVTLRKLEAEIGRNRSILNQELRTQTLYETQVEEASDSLAAAGKRFDVANQSLRRSIHGWSAAARDVIPHDDISVDDFVLDGTRESDDQTNPRESIWRIVKTAIDRATATNAARRHQWVSQVDEIRQDIAAWTEQRTRLIDGEHQPPPPPYTRQADVRKNRAGGPLYQLCDFCDSVPQEQRGNWEAALEASGLLDAFVLIDGTLDAENMDDVTLIAEGPIENSNLQLARVLQPAATLPAGMSPGVVRGLLKSIGCGRDSSNVWVDHDGSWQVGPKHGHWTKPIAQHIGAAAREQRRQQQIESLTDQIEVADEELNSILSEIEELDRQRVQIEKLEHSFPSDRDWIAAVSTVAAARGTLANAESRLTDQLARVGTVREDLAGVVARRDRDAEDLAMTRWVDDLEHLQQTLQQFSTGLESLRRDLQDVIRHQSTHDQFLADHHAAKQLDEQRREQWQTAGDDLAAKQTELDTLNQNVGADVREIQTQIVDGEQQEQTIEDRLKQLRETINDLAGEKGKLQGSLQTSRNILETFETDRQFAINRVSQLADTGLVQQAVEVDLPESPWSPTRAAQIALSIRGKLRDIPMSDEAWNDAQNTIQVEFRALENAMLPTGNTPQSQTQDEVTVVTIPFGGIVCSPSLLATQMADEVRHNETMITERERELFEQRLIGDIAQSLHQNIRDAHALCKGMNDEVESRPMSTGMRLRFQWRATQDGSDDLKTACQALLRKPAAMSKSDRTAVGGFLQRQIQDARHRDDAGTWQQHLAEALDYRTWFSFDIQRETDGRWQRLTRRTHGTGSGGERAVALIIPMLAALSAYYHSADPIAPRIILMDEAFVGIDNEMRAKFMDLLVQFDLDFVMTSEREWGCYPTMPSLAIYHLATRRGIDAILPTRWVWNGNGKRMDDSHEQMRQAALFETQNS